VLLNKEQIKQADDLPTKIVHMPEWGGDVKIRMMTGEIRMAYEKSSVLMKTDNEKILNMIIYSCVNEDGSLMFDKDDLPFLLSKSFPCLIRLVGEINSLSVLTEKSVEDAVKNS